MSEEQKAIACGLYKKRARKITLRLAAEAVLVTAILEFLIVFLGKNDEPSLLIFVAVMFILFFLVINIRDVLYAAKSFAAASYISRHDTDMLLVTPNGFYKSIALRLFTRYPLDADMARYTLDGKERTAMIRNMLRLDKGSRQLLVFRGVDNGKVYAVPAIYMKELARQAKSAVDEQS